MNLRGIFDLNSKKDELKNLEEKLNEDNFWQDVDNANVINKKISHLKKEINLYEELDKELNESIEIVSSEDDELINLISDNIKLLEEKINELEIATLLNGEFDEYNCFLEIHPGAGGTESCDWTSMLFRMYEKFCEKEGFSWETIDEAKGDEAGLKSVMIKITGDFAFGYLKFESGVHRLVRISPFDSGARRHTSFASVTVFPEIKKNISIEIKEEDLKIDVYHSSGAGGQSVNTSNSAVRITHLPSKIVVTCQNERSQLKNKEQALNILKNKLYMLEYQKEQEKINALKENNQSINFGSQIRSYILEPYKLIKDHRTNYENNDPEKILNGFIMDMLIYNLKNINKGVK
ncbi:MAG: peptide chain release factor 2 [Bacilli bacterium]